MRELPILFSSEMVRAILDGRKSMTRRIIKPQPMWIAEPNIPFKTPDADPKGIIRCPYGQPGDRLWVRETWYYESHMHELTAGEPDLPSGRYKHRYIFRADCPDYPVDVGVGEHGWKPSIFMPREAARIWLEVTDVRVERLQEITWKDVEAEGLRPINNPLIYEDKETTFSIYQNDFINLWNDIAYKNDKTRFKTECGKYTWDENPWVWIIEFKRLEANP